MSADAGDPFMMKLCFIYHVDGSMQKRRNSSNKIGFFDKISLGSFEVKWSDCLLFQGELLGTHTDFDPFQ